MAVHQVLQTTASALWGNRGSKSLGYRLDQRREPSMMLHVQIVSEMQLKIWDVTLKRMICASLVEDRPPHLHTLQLRSKCMRDTQPFWEALRVQLLRPIFEASEVSDVLPREVKRTRRWSRCLWRWCVRMIWAMHLQSLHKVVYIAIIGTESQHFLIITVWVAEPFIKLSGDRFWTSHLSLFKLCCMPVSRACELYLQSEVSWQAIGHSIVINITHTH